MTAKPRCLTCDHWHHSSSPAPLKAFCFVLSNTVMNGAPEDAFEVYVADSKDILDQSGVDWFVTPRDFGCIHHSSLEELL